MLNWTTIQEEGWKTRFPGEFRILSIDGGGMRGVFPARYLQFVEDKIERPIHEYFDLITGTSTGGIIALGLAKGLSASQITNLYVEKGNKIFGRKRSFGCFKSMYRNDDLKKLLQETFEDSLLEEARTLMCIPTITYQKSKPNVLKTPHSPNLHMDRDMKMWEVALATSAAPVYLPAATLGTRGVRVDGGMWANNPSMVGIIEAMHLGFPVEDIHMLSIGTGTPNFEKKDSKVIRGGVVAWNFGKDIISTTMETQSASANHMSCFLLKDRLARINFESSRSMKLDSTKRETLEFLKNKAYIKFQETFSDKENIQKKFFNNSALNELGY